MRTKLTFNCAMLALLGAGTGLVSLLLGASGLELAMFRLYFTSPMIMLLNLLPPILLIFLVYFVSGRAWIAFSLPSLFLITASVVGLFKVQVRGEPLAASDIAFIREAGNVARAYPLTVNWKIFFAAAAFVLGTLFSVFVLKHRLEKAPVRIIAAVAVIAVSTLLYMLVYMNRELYARTTVEIEGTEWSALRSYIAKGFLYPFIHSAQDALPAGYPDWYDELKARQALESYADADIPDDKKINIISIMLEAYSDLSTFGILEFEDGVYDPLHRLQAESVSGMLITNSFGGGTIETERLFLTGNTRLTPYRAATNSYVHYLKNQGYHTEGLHAGDAWFYDRRPTNARLGFESYYFIDDFENGSRADSFFFPAIMELYEARDRSKPYFSFNISYQNHGPYGSAWTAEQHVIARAGLSDEAFNILNNYLNGIYDTNRHLESFIDSLRNDPAPTVVLVFGDHMPWLGNGKSVYTELGINVDISTNEGFLNCFSVPYFIWANDSAKNALENEFTGGGSFSPCFLMGELFSQCSWEGEGYMQALREIRAHVDVISAPTGLFRENGILTEAMAPDMWQEYLRLRMMEIYRRNNFSY